VSITGARILLLASAALSVATALALADVHPSFLGRQESIECEEPRNSKAPYRPCIR